MIGLYFEENKIVQKDYVLCCFMLIHPCLRHCTIYIYTIQHFYVNKYKNTLDTQQ